MVFGSFEATTLSSQMIAFGFKSLESGHTYIVGDVALDGTVISSPVLTNWNLYYPIGESPTITTGDNGPKESEAIEIGATANLFARRNLTTSFINRSALVNDVSEGDTVITVVDATEFNNANRIDITDGDNISTGHAIQSINSATNEITIAPAATIDVSKQSINQGVAEITGESYAVLYDGTTFQLLVKDAQVSESVVFFLQSRDGGLMEWDFTPFSDWIYSNLFWIDQTAPLPISIFDENDDPFPDGTMIVLEVDQREQLGQLLEIDENPVDLTETASIGDTKIYIVSIEGYSVGMNIDILGGSGKVQTLTIKEVGTEGSKPYIVVFEPLQFEFDPNTEEARIVTNDKTQRKLSEESLVALSLPLVDVTPVETGKALDTALRQPHDPPAVAPSVDPSDEDEVNAIYDSLNTNKSVIQRGAIDIPTIDGFAFSRVLPITEDVLTANSVKDKIAEDLLRGEPNPIYTEQTEQQTGDFESIEIPSLGAEESTTLEGIDYVIETPVFLRNGSATSNMSTTSVELSSTGFEGYNIPGVPIPLYLQTKTYTIFPHIREETQTGALKAVQYFDPFEVNFSNPVKIHSTKDSTGLVDFYCEDIWRDEFGCTVENGYKLKTVHGVHAQGDGFVIDYVVANRGILVQSGDLSITVYSSTTFDQEGWACGNGKSQQTREYLNVTYPSKIEEIGGQQVEVEVLSDIDTWRKGVEENPFSQVIESTQPATNTGTGLGFLDDIQEQLDQSVIGQYYAGLEALISTGETVSSGYDFYQNPLRWTKATQYTEHTFTIPIVNGKARLELASNATVAALFVEAAYALSGSRFEAIRADLVFVRNPLMMGGLTPYKTFPSGNPEERYELGGTVTWNDGDDGVIEDNTIVSYSLSTPANPSVSSTANGWAGGVFMGPKDQIIIVPDPLLDSICRPPPVSEKITVTIEHSSGWKNTLTRTIYWEPVILDEASEFYFKVEGGSLGWSDGTQNPPATVTSDLEDGFNETLLWVGEEGVLALRGAGQPGGRARPLGSSSLRPRISYWDRSNITVSHPGLNQSIGHHPTIYGGLPKDLYTSPWDTEVIMVTSYYDGDRRLTGQGLTALPYPQGEAIIYPHPYVSFGEPLSISVSIENEFLRDGTTRGVVVADVSWRNKPITNKFVINEGLENETIIYYPMPIITFSAGECSGDLNSTRGEEPQYKDYRGGFSCCLDVSDHRDVSLSTYAIETSLSRSTVFQDGATSQSHYHHCTVDENGVGQTTATITTVGATVNDHVHTVTDYAIDDVTYVNGAASVVSHGHTIRSVAITEILPMTNATLSFSVIGIVEYDPTNCYRYTESKAGVGSRYPKVGNRMMFNSVSSSPLTGGNVGEPTEPELILELIATGVSDADVPTYYAAETIGETAKGFNISAKAYFTEYFADDGAGGIVTVPQRDVTDGTRIVTDYTVFLPESEIEGGISTDVVVTGPDVKRNYMWLVVNATISTEGKFAEEEIQVAVDSNLNWLPGFNSLVTDPTNDAIYVANAISYTRTIGSSAMYDATRLAARRMIRHQELFPVVEDHKKAIILLTDGDENKSEYSLDQAIASVFFMDTTDPPPIIPLRLGQTYSANEVILTKIYVDTNGFMLSSLDLETADIESLVDAIFENPNWIVGKGVYRNEAALDQPSIPDKLYLKDVVAPTGTDVEFRYRTSDDGISWGIWSEWLFYTEQHSIEEVLDATTLYFEYEIRLSGNSDFVSPQVKQDLTISYYDPSDFAMFFNPVSVGGGSAGGGSAGGGDDYGVEEGNRFLSSIHITHEVDLPPTSTVQYGITQSDSNDLDTFYTPVDADEHTILLTRYNEPLITDDNRVFTALNGNWPDRVDISVHRINEQYPNGIVVDASEYAPNNLEGIVTFYTTQPSTDQFAISVEVYPSFRLVCRVTNFGGKRAIIHHIGIVYNMMKRIPTDDNGNIIHTPINSRIS